MSKVALVTGASRGIGAAIAGRLVQQGLFVIGTATSVEGAERIGDALGEGGVGQVLNVADISSIAAALEAMSGYDAPSVLVNNAGVTRDNLMLRMSEEEWSSVIDTNLTGLYRITKACLRGMVKARWGRIVSVSSVVARMGNPGQANYVASKAGIEGFSRALALEIASRNITVNTVSPGFIETDMTGSLTDEQKQKMLDRIPAQRMGSVDEVAAAVAYLVSDEAGYVTGQTLQVNGGLYAA
ncbi:MAG: 3-oxoacyl-[acyl-carrier protein] reductase [Candidatus Azotimanducaceae bacterium]|jgi:3-oxoacyl-[acyl-carrier protein] reductase